MNNENAEMGFGALLFILGFCFIVLIFGFLFFTVSVQAGSVGVQDTFGSVDNNVLQPGFHLKNPFTGVISFSTRTMKYIDYGKDDKATIVALSNDGLSTTMEVAVNFHINPDKAVQLYKDVGPNYMDVVMVNPIHAVPRDLISKYDTKTLYSASLVGSTDRAKLEQELYEGITARMNAVGVRDSIIIEQVSIRLIDFPQGYKDTITAKMNMDTDKQKKATEVELQRLEAERVVAQAQGIADANVVQAKGEAEANQIRTASLSEILNEYLWIQSMANNPKAIYVPIGTNGLPLFKNVDAGTASQ